MTKTFLRNPIVDYGVVLQYNVAVMSMERGEHRQVNSSFVNFMAFPRPEKTPWATDFLNHHLRVLGAREPVVTIGVVDSIRNCYAQQPSNRYYHGPDHASFVGAPHVPKTLAERLSYFSKPQAESLLAVAGLWHDVAYKHVDAFDGTDQRAWPTALRKHIDGMAEYAMTLQNGKPIFRTFFTDEGQADAVTRMVAGIFDVGENGIIHNQGGNEFDSALAATKFLERQGASSESIVAVGALIAGTIPFRLSADKDQHGTIVDDGYMGQLAKRVKEVSLTLEDEIYQPSWEQVNDIMLLTTHMANRDISPFILPNNAPDVIQGGRQVKKEEVRALRAGVTTMGELVASASQEASAPLLYSWLRSDVGISVPVPADNVPSIYLPRDNEGQIMVGSESYPPQIIFEEALEITRENCDLTSLYFEAHEVGISFAASIATLIDEPDAPVPGFVYSQIWDYKAPEIGIKTAGEHIVYKELMEGTHQIDVDSATPRRSPIAATLLTRLGAEGIRALSRQIKEIRSTNAELMNPFAERGVAESFFNETRELIGEDFTQAIITELQRVATHFQDDPVRGNSERAHKLIALLERPEEQRVLDRAQWMAQRGKLIFRDWFMRTVQEDRNWVTQDHIFGALPPVSEAYDSFFTSIKGVTEGLALNDLEAGTQRGVLFPAMPELLDYTSMPDFQFKSSSTLPEGEPDTPEAHRNWLTRLKMDSIKFAFGFTASAAIEVGLQEGWQEQYDTHDVYTKMVEVLRNPTFIDCLDDLAQTGFAVYLQGGVHNIDAPRERSGLRNAMVNLGFDEQTCPPVFVITHATSENGLEYDQYKLAPEVDALRKERLREQRDPHSTVVVDLRERYHFRDKTAIGKFSSGCPVANTDVIPELSHLLADSLEATLQFHSSSSS